MQGLLPRAHRNRNSRMLAILLSLATMTALLLMIGGFWMWTRDRKRSLLLLATSVVILFNVWMWTTMPDPRF